MTCIFEFDLCDAGGLVWTNRRFKVTGVMDEKFQETLEDEEGSFFRYIEKVEFEGPGPTHGTIDQFGTTNADGTETIWSLLSYEIENKEGFIQQTVAEISKLYGWELTEI